MIAGRERWVVGALVSSAFLLRVALALVIAPMQAPDEASHVRYVEVLGSTGRLPVQPKISAPHWEQYYQPPLAYLLFVPLERVLADASESTKVRALRLQNCVYGALMVAVGYWVVALLTPPGDGRRPLAGAVLALLPGFAVNASVVNNDALANLLAAFLWLPLLGGKGTWRAAVATGAVFGAACLTKLSVLALSPLLLLVPLLRRPGGLRTALGPAAVSAVVAAALLTPWCVRNALVYGDVLAIDAGSISFASLGRFFPPEKVAALARPTPELAFIQFWGCFGIFNNLSWSPIPLVAAPLAAIALCGWLRPRPERGRDGFRIGATAFAAAFALAAAALTLFSLRYLHAWQGRYLYTTAVPFAALMAGGWERLPGDRLRWAFLVALVLLLAALDIGVAVKLHRFFSAEPALSWGLGVSL